METNLENLIEKLENIKGFIEQYKDNRNYYYDHAIYKNKPLDSFVNLNNQLLELKQLVKGIEDDYLKTIENKNLESLSNEELDRVLNDLETRSEHQNQLITQLKHQIHQMELLKIN